MTQETKSIFTSQKDFSSRIADPEQTADSACAPSTTIAPSRVSDGVANTRQDADSAAQADKANLKNTRRPSFNANVPLQAQATASKDRPRAPSFRKPDRPQTLTLPSLPQLTHASKHPRTDETGNGRDVSNSEPPLKKSRPKLRPRHTLDPDNFSTGFCTTRAQPPSPLFFSHSPRQRPILPTSFSSAEAAAMLNKARDESAGGGLTTLKLARGSISTNTSSPPRSGSTPGSRASIERNSIPRSPDHRGKKLGLQLLGTIGIIELLEQDDRPQFIIDVANSANFTPGGPLLIVFANASLRAYPTILELVTGKPDLYVKAIYSLVQT
jgi:hypothetical protein